MGFSGMPQVPFTDINTVLPVQTFYHGTTYHSTILHSTILIPVHSHYGRARWEEGTGTISGACRPLFLVTTCHLPLPGMPGILLPFLPLFLLHGTTSESGMGGAWEAGMGGCREPAATCSLFSCHLPTSPFLACLWAPADGLGTPACTAIPFPFAGNLPCGGGRSLPAIGRLPAWDYRFWVSPPYLCRCRFVLGGNSPYRCIPPGCHQTHSAIKQAWVLGSRFPFCSCTVGMPHLPTPVPLPHCTWVTTATTATSACDSGYHHSGVRSTTFPGRCTCHLPAWVHHFVTSGVPALGYHSCRSTCLEFHHSPGTVLTIPQEHCLTTALHHHRYGLPVLGLEFWSAGCACLPA